MVIIWNRSVFPLPFLILVSVISLEHWQKCTFFSIYLMSLSSFKWKKKDGKRFEGGMFPLSITEKSLSTFGPVESAREPELHWAFLSFYSAFVVKTGRQWSKNKRQEQRRWEGWKRCRKRGDISLLPYGRVIACVELCCRVLENHLLHRKVTASKMLAWRWRYVLWPRVGPGDGFLPIVLQRNGNSIMVLYSSTTGKLDLRSPMLTFLSSCFWHANNSWEHTWFFWT